MWEIVPGISRWLQRSVCGVEGQIQEEGIRCVLSDVCGRAIRQRICQTVDRRDRRRAVQDPVRAGADVEIRVPSGQEPEELVEPPPHRVEPLLHSQMPFPERGGAIACCFQPIGDCRFAEGKSDLSLARFEIELVPKPLLIAARQEASTRRAAVRTADIGIRESDTLAGQPIDVRSGNITGSVHADVRVAHVIGHDQEDVRPPFRLRGPFAVTQPGSDDRDDERENRPRREFHCTLPRP
jgi:hypothetical protein